MSYSKLYWLPLLTLVTMTILSATAPFVLAQAPQNPPPQGQKPMMQCPMMTGLNDFKVFPASPATLLAQSKQLGLSDEQTKRLEGIEKDAQEKARSVLTPEQQRQLGATPEKPLSIMEWNMQRMKAKMAQKDMKDMGQMCPMCMKMMQERMKQQGK